MTGNLIFPPKTPRSRRLVAVLRIKHSWSTHQEAAAWYRAQKLPLPGNCMVRGNEPLPLDYTDRYQDDLRAWEAHYWQVARKHGDFHACEKIFCDVNAPPRLTNRQLVEWFGMIPDPRDPQPLAAKKFILMLEWLWGQPAFAASRQKLQ